MEKLNYKVIPKKGRFEFLCQGGKAEILTKPFFGL